MIGRSQAGGDESSQGKRLVLRAEIAARLRPDLSGHTIDVRVRAAREQHRIQRGVIMLDKQPERFPRRRRPHSAATDPA
ncbi:hypothetical protein SIM91_03855 [Rhodococcus opacus]|uniref:hypothetical protein n=1 Tax=Rhodococcus opacus TaxID=37919 RepID=UPI0007CD6FFD|nr:hypothetical protein [Rhodococcus opacus]MDX5962476.1 hypothetical protein [Rhodococcus opacus]